MRLLLTMLLAAAFGPASYALDRLTPTAGSAQEVVFLGFEGGAFQLLNAEQKTVRQLISATLELRLVPPREVTVTPRAGKPETMELQRYDKGQFIFTRNGVAAPRPLSLVKRIEVPFSAQDAAFDPAPQADAPSLAPAPADAPPPPRELAAPGRVTIVHFHLPQSVASARQGSLASTLARDSRGAVVLRKVDVADWNSPVVQQYDLKSLPQFWFYNARGDLVTKLVDRFTDEDISTALRRAQR